MIYFAQLILKELNTQEEIKAKERDLYAINDKTKTR